MQNEEKQIVDLYIPRKCSATNGLIKAKDAASVQIDIAEVLLLDYPNMSVGRWERKDHRKEEDFRFGRLC